MHGDTLDTANKLKITNINCMYKKIFNHPKYTHKIRIMTQDDYFIITINHGTVKKSNEAIIVRST
jgi:hypothetical protein